jgi:hypothetical protein
MRSGSTFIRNFTTQRSVPPRHQNQRIEFFRLLHKALRIEINYLERADVTAFSTT